MSIRQPISLRLFHNQPDSSLITAYGAGNFVGSPMVGADVLYSSSGNSKVNAIDHTTGTVLWSKQGGDSEGIYSSACVVDANGTVYHPACSGEQD